MSAGMSPGAFAYEWQEDDQDGDGDHDDDEQYGEANEQRDS